MQNEVVFYARRLIEAGLAFGTSGNVSLREGDTIWVTPSGVPFEKIHTEDLVGIDLATGSIRDGFRRPSSEVPLHRSIYRARPDVSAVVHTHSPYATVFSCLHRPILALHYQIAHIGTQIPVAPYATFGSEDLGENAVRTLGESGRAVLLGNHGALAVGESLDKAFQTACDLEWLATLYWRALQIGSPAILPDEEIARVRSAFTTYGQIPASGAGEHAPDER